MKKIMLLFGTRPEAIKMAPLYAELHARPEVTTVTVVSSQHRELLHDVLTDMNIVPDYDLSLMHKGQTPCEICHGVLSGLEPIIMHETPDCIAVHGDTATAASGAVCGFYSGVPVAHIEAGLRTHNMHSPFPEEFNRRVISLASALHFAPTEAARQNLLGEGIDDSRIFVTGNTSVDVIKHTVTNDYSHPLLESLSGKRILLITAHRRESVGDAMRSAFRGIRRALALHPDTSAIYPMHPSPAVREIAECEFRGCEAVHLIEPLSVIDFHNFLASCHAVITDSGGIQEEAAYLGKPTLVMRAHTEREEALRGNTLRLVGTDTDNVCRELCHLLDDSEHYLKMAQPQMIFGDGTAAKKIADVLCVL